MENFTKKAASFLGLDEWETPVTGTDKANLRPPFRHLFWEALGLRRQNIEIIYGTPENFVVSRYLNLHNKDKIWGIRIFGILCLSKTDRVCTFDEALAKCNRAEVLPNIADLRNTIRPFLDEINRTLCLMRNNGVEAEEIAPAAHWTSEIKDQYEMFCVNLKSGIIDGYQKRYNLYTRTKIR